MITYLAVKSFFKRLRDLNLNGESIYLRLMYTYIYRVLVNKASLKEKASDKGIVILLILEES